MYVSEGTCVYWCECIQNLGGGVDPLELEMTDICFGL